MNCNSLPNKVLSTRFPSTHPFSLPAASTNGTTTETAFLLANGNPAVLTLPQGTEVYGSYASAAPEINGAQPSAGNGLARWPAEQPIFNTTSFDNRPFKYRVSGYIAGGGTVATTVSATLKVYLGTSATLASNTALASSNSFNVGGVKSNWYIDSTMQWDSVSQLLQGQFAMYVNGAQVGNGTVITSQSSISLSSLSFLMSYTFATTNTANTVGLVEASLEKV